jgi:hypothetical protein
MNDRLLSEIELFLFHQDNGILLHQYHLMGFGEAARPEPVHINAGRDGIAVIIHSVPYHFMIPGAPIAADKRPNFTAEDVINGDIDG